MTQQQLTFDHSVRDRIERLLARVEGIRRGIDIGRSVVFDDAGAAHAAAVAANDPGGTVSFQSGEFQNHNAKCAQFVASFT
ncbi:hypothetical protein [Lacipirellula limnantheis]|uniref:Uncharacterized protein n=1 Tax=Lacipirellula limnantheis TaxID=2528024 RepID=A0A517U2K1_9BACT|nr:hypothetical protein [Lacipirellula limnantheis]QDT74833.1 hypothetical protein I41_40360 [Lacipirellula limnantheis]